MPVFADFRRLARRKITAPLSPPRRLLIFRFFAFYLSPDAGIAFR